MYLDSGGYLLLNNLEKLEMKYFFIRFDIRMLNEYIFDSVWPFFPQSLEWEETIGYWTLAEVSIVCCSMLPFTEQKYNKNLTDV